MTGELVRQALGHPKAGRFAQAYLEGDVSALYPLLDIIEEEREVQTLKTGQAYFFKTYAHYYIGRLILATITDIVIEEVVEVYQTGPIEDLFKTGLPAEYESYPPDIRHTLNAGHVVDTIDWPMKIPTGRKI